MTLLPLLIPRSNQTMNPKAPLGNKISNLATAPCACLIFLSNWRLCRAWLRCAYCWAGSFIRRWRCVQNLRGAALPLRDAQAAFLKNRTIVAVVETPPSHADARSALRAPGLGDDTAAQYLHCNNYVLLPCRQLSPAISYASPSPASVCPRRLATRLRRRWRCCCWPDCFRAHGTVYSAVGWAGPCGRHVAFSRRLAVA